MVRALRLFEAKEVIGAQMIGDSVIAFSKVDEENIRISYYSSQGETWGHSTEKTPIYSPIIQA